MSVPTSIFIHMCSMCTCFDLDHTVCVFNSFDTKFPYDIKMISAQHVCLCACPITGSLTARWTRETTRSTLYIYCMTDFTFNTNSSSPHCMSGFLFLVARMPTAIFVCACGCVCAITVHLMQTATAGAQSHMLHPLHLSSSKREVYGWIEPSSRYSH